jgi:hypothetical protein
MTGWLVFLIIILLFIGLYVIQGYAQNQGLKWVFVSFSAILLGSTIIFYLLPEPKDTNLDFLTEHGEIAQAKLSYSNLVDSALAGDIEAAKDVTLLHQWSLEFSGDSLDIPETNFTDPLIFVERKSTDDGKVEVLQYSSKIIFGGIDFSKKIKPLDVDLTGNILTITQPEPLDIAIAGFKKDFVVAQFNKRKENPLVNPSDYRSFLQAVYVKIPKSTEFPKTLCSIRW